MARGASHIKFLSTEDKANSPVSFINLHTVNGTGNGRPCNDRGVGGFGGLSHAQSVKIRSGKRTTRLSSRHRN